MIQTIHCAGCGSADWKLQETWLAYQLATCSRCGVTFTVNPDYKRDRYVAAYAEASNQLPVPENHAYVYASPKLHLVLETMALPGLLPPPRLTPAERVALRWLKSCAPNHALIIDCGCGAGRFLRGLTRAGFQAIGTEISEPLVISLNRCHLNAILGGAPDFPWDGPAPFAISFFEVLEHFPDPASIIERLRERFPSTHILASVPSPRRTQLLLNGKRDLSDYPPNHFIRWTPAGLERFFRNAGYSSVQLRLPAPAGSEMMQGLGQIVLRSPNRPGLRGMRGYLRVPNGNGNTKPAIRVGATAALWFIRGYQWAADVVGFPSAWRARRKGASAGSLLVIASP
jgi:SAM-dependent methyltransferase